MAEPQKRGDSVGRKEQYRCLILAILVFLSGMWCENSMTGFRAENAAADADNAYILSAGDAVGEAQLCTEEMLNVRTHAGLLQLAGRLIHQSGKARPAFAFLCSDTLSLAEGKFYTGSEEISFSGQCPEELVVTYMHQSDGKKRI